MFRNQAVFTVLVVLMAAGCHSPVKKEEGKVAAKPAPVVTQKEPARIEQTPSALPGTYVSLDTVVHHDTIKVVLYNNTMIKCSLNRLSDTYNAAQNSEDWEHNRDFPGQDNIPNRVDAILVPGIKKPQKFILNDSLLIIPVASSFTTGGILLFVLERTKKKLSFPKGDKANPIIQGPEYIYVDLKKNVIIGHDGNEIYDDEENAGDGEPGRFLIYRYKISNRHFVLTDVVASYIKQFDEGLLTVDTVGSYERAFYNFIIKHENWQRDKYDCK